MVRANRSGKPGRGFMRKGTDAQVGDTNVKIVLAYAELDPGIMNAQFPAATLALRDEMCKVGKDHCPETWMLKGESHMSEVFSVDTADRTVSDPVLKFVKKVK